MKSTRTFRSLRSVCKVPLLAIGLIAVSCTCYAQSAALTPSSLAFDDEPVGMTSEPETVTLTNTGAAPLTVTAIFFSGAQALSFSRAGGSCVLRISLAAGASCTIGVVFTPATIGAAAPTLTVTSLVATTGAALVEVVTLSGIGVSPPIVVDANTPPCVNHAHQYTDIQTAVNNAPSGATIVVCPGTYAQQITINKSLTLRGVTNTAANKGAAVVTPPSSGLVVNYTNFAVYNGGFSAAVQVLVQAPNVNISNLSVDGTRPPSTGFDAFGIIYDNGSSGTLRHVALTNQRVCVSTANSASCAFGGGLMNFGSLEVLNSSIRGFDYVGIYVVSGASPTIVKESFVECGNAPLLSPTGISLYAHLGSTQISENTISACGGGIEANFYGAPAINISGNNLVNDGFGVGIFGPYNSGANVTISGNNIAANYGILFGDMNLGAVQYNTITGALAGITLQNSSGVSVSNNTIFDAILGIVGVAGNTVSNNTFLNVTTLTQ
jgi:parallel beta-helix repeat protein